MTMGAPPDHSDDADLVREILRRVAARVSAVSEGDLQAVEAEIREEYGGRRIFVAKRRRQGVPVNRRLSDAQREALVREAITTTKSNEELQAQYGVSRATLYRHFKK